MLKFLLCCTALAVITLPASALMYLPAPGVFTSSDSSASLTLSEVIEESSLDVQPNDNEDLIDFSPVSLRKIELSMLRVTNG